MSQKHLEHCIIKVKLTYIVKHNGSYIGEAATLKQPSELWLVYKLVTQLEWEVRKSKDSKQRSWMFPLLTSTYSLPIHIFMNTEVQPIIIFYHVTTSLRPEAIRNCGNLETLRCFMFPWAQLNALGCRLKDWVWGNRLLQVAPNLNIWWWWWWWCWSRCWW